MKIISITVCKDCPFFTRTEVVGRIAYIPICTKVSNNRTLPYVRASVGTKSYAIPTFIIPDWCPLDDIP